MPKFRKKPVTIEAIRINRRMTVETLEGTMRGNLGDWLVTGVKDEQYFCKDDIFRQTYESTDEDSRIELGKHQKYGSGEWVKTPESIPRDWKWSKGPSGDEIEKRWNKICGGLDFDLATVQFTSGAGGDEANDWTRILASVYESWAMKNLVKCTRLSIEYGDVGFKQILLRFSGKNVLDFFVHQEGIHRLVRNSPHDPIKRRHTSFAGIRVCDNHRQLNSVNDQVFSCVLDPYQQVTDLRTGQIDKNAYSYLMGHSPLLQYQGASK